MIWTRWATRWQFEDHRLHIAQIREVGVSRPLSGHDESEVAFLQKPSPTVYSRSELADLVIEKPSSSPMV
jgi:hypothetical protein